MAGTDLFTPLTLGELRLSHRIVMAPLTRQRASAPGNVPNALMAEYYGQRASEGGLIVSEATQVSQSGQGYPLTPGIHSDEQVEGWSKITEAVHRNGGLIVLQLWHTGRVSSSSYQSDGGSPFAPSAIPASGHETPRPLSRLQIAQIVEEFAEGARKAKSAGFDGVEIHGANGYLLDQFLQDGTNHRTDEYGGSIENRARLPLAIVDAVMAVWGNGRTGIRLSPWGRFNDMLDSDPVPLFRHVLQELSKRELAYVHLIEPRHQEDMPDGVDDNAPSVSQLFRQDFNGRIISAGNYNRERAIDAVRSGRVDAVAFGRHFIANPDLPLRLQLDAPLNPYDRSTFYGGDAKGYIDYPALQGIIARNAANEIRPRARFLV